MTQLYRECARPKVARRNTVRETRDTSRGLLGMLENLAAMRSGLDTRGIAIAYDDIHGMVIFLTSRFPADRFTVSVFSPRPVETLMR